MAARLPVARFSKARQNKVFFSKPEPEKASSKCEHESSEPVRLVAKKSHLPISKIHEKWRHIIEVENLRQSKEPQFHLHPLSDSKDPNVIILRFFCTNFQVNLVTVRGLLFMINLFILVAAIISFQAWIWIDALKLEATKGLSRMEKDRDSLYIPHPWLHDRYHALAHGFAHADQILFASGILLMGYYVIFGIFVSYHFGTCLTNMAFSVLCYPPIATFVAGELIFTGFAFLELRHELNIMDCEEVKWKVTYMRMNAMTQMRTLMDAKGILISLSMIGAGVMMILQGLLPFFMYDLPFQRKMDVDDLVLSHDPKQRSVKRYKVAGHDHIIPYRDLSAAFTVMLQLCKPELRDFHRSMKPY